MTHLHRCPTCGLLFRCTGHLERDEDGRAHCEHEEYREPLCGYCAEQERIDAEETDWDAIHEAAHVADLANKGERE